MKRKEGFIEIEKMLQEIGIDINNMKEVSTNPLIKCHYCTETDVLIEFNYKNEKYFYKYKMSTNPYNELIINELASDFGIPCAEYDTATLLGKKGILTKNYKKEYSKYILGEQILLDFWDDNIIYRNNLENIWDALEYRYQSHPNKKEILEKLMKKIVSIFIFDIITCQGDRHSLNWEVEENDDFIDISPIYDNEQILTPIAKKQYISLTMNNIGLGNLIEELKLFVKVSSEEFRTIIKERLWIISEENLKSIFERIEKKIEYPMPESIKEFYMIEYQKHRNNLEKTLNQEESIRKR